MVETLIQSEVFTNQKAKLDALARNEALEDFVWKESLRIKQENIDLAEQLGISYEEGPLLLTGFSAAHYAMGAALSYMLIRESKRFNGKSTPKITSDNLYHYNSQLMEIATTGGSKELMEWFKNQAHTLVPDLTSHFEQAMGQDLRAEMYWGMVDVAYPFAVEAGLVK